MKKQPGVVVVYLGHCGARPNRYEIFKGTMNQCYDYLDGLPAMPPNKVCHCGGYTGTVPVREVAHVELDR